MIGHKLNDRVIKITFIILKTPEGVARDMFCLSHREGSGLSTTYSPRQVDPIRDDQSLIDPPVYARKKKRKKKKWLFIHLEDYRPLNRASYWLLQITSQMRGTLYVSDQQGH